ncbi:MAG: hypothetical protein H6964_02350 [Chromatiaceae bacterium]|nr:hypothetical protein [Gammaproteobacteria bacterium]MCB1872885.1 hypothetical protein [Gammaproteobacteria bacterium]MCB1881633.1 hypothetical protein [Gammaproteobacteria bacterium]MCB1903855.1 hypothetical protein [Gammaproteobacteria bacterium]MCP5445821.1 hypothetical protein [Chromatiaceae bacterium]
MPYFVYQISEDKQLKCIDSIENYKAARNQVRQLRSEQMKDDTSLIRLIHASSQLEAERLLLTPRATPVEGDD